MRISYTVFWSYSELLIGLPSSPYQRNSVSFSFFQPTSTIWAVHIFLSVWPFKRIWLTFQGPHLQIKMILLPPSQLPIVSYLRIKICANHPAVLLAFPLSRVCTGLVHTVTTTLGPYAQLSFCVQKTLLHCSHSLPLSLTTLNPSTDRSDWVGRGVIDVTQLMQCFPVSVSVP